MSKETPDKILKEIIWEIHEKILKDISQEVSENIQAEFLIESRGNT